MLVFDDRFVLTRNMVPLEILAIYHFIYFLSFCYVVKYAFNLLFFTSFHQIFSFVV